MRPVWLGRYRPCLAAHAHGSSHRRVWQRRCGAGAGVLCPQLAQCHEDHGAQFFVAAHQQGRRQVCEVQGDTDMKGLFEVKHSGGLRPARTHEVQ